MPWFDYSVYLDIIGVWRSLVAYLLWEQGVGGSNPPTPIFSLRNFWALDVWKTLSVLEVLGGNFEDGWGWLRILENFWNLLYQKTSLPCKLRYSPCTLCHVLSLRTSERLWKCSVVHWAPQWLLRGYLIILYIYWNSSEVFWNVCVGYVQRITEDIGYSLRLSDNQSVAPVYLHPGVL